MKISFFLSTLILFVISCVQQDKKEVNQSLIDKVQVSSLKVQVPSLIVPTNTINKSKLEYDKSNSTWSLQGKPFSGYAVTYSQDSILIQKFGLLNGKKQNESFEWYPDGHLKLSTNYHQGKLHGEKKTWSSDSSHVLVAHLNYHLGKAHGAQKKWYPTGELFKKLNLNMGKEEGMQQAFRKNGDLFANYEARDGRIYGLKKSALCFGLEDESIK